MTEAVVFTTPTIHAVRGLLRSHTMCGRHIDATTGTPENHDREAITWEVALHDSLETCARCRKSYGRSQRLLTGCSK